MGENGHIPHDCAVGYRNIPINRRTPFLKLAIGSDDIEIWPADPDHIEALGKRLIEIANELREDK